MKIVQRKLSDLTPAPYNPRKITAEELEQLTRSIERWGMVEPLVVNTRDDLIIGGHQRAAAAASLGLETVPVVEVDLDDAQARALNLALNKLGGDWDRAQLETVLAELSDELADLSGFVTDLEEPEESRPVRFEKRGHGFDAGDHKIRAPHAEDFPCSICRTLTDHYS